MRKQKSLSLASKLAIGWIAFSAALSACGTTTVSSRRDVGDSPNVTPAVIYVSDFDLDVTDIKSERGILPPLPKAPGPFGDLLPPPPGAPKEPRKLARELVDSMSASLVKQLTQAGFDARHLDRRETMPISGWLVRGVFTNVNQGNQLQRAVIGFGVGKTDLQVLVDVNDLEKGTPAPFYELKAAADSGKAPGAGPMIVLGPAGVAARFVLAGNDLGRSVKQAAATIASEIVSRTRRETVARTD